MNRIVTFIITLVLTPLAALHAADDKPKILFIMADELGDVQCNNHERGKIPTPHIARLAVQGMPFTLAFLATASSRNVLALDYPYQTAEPQKSGWPLTAEERAYVLKPEHERRPGSEAKKHLPAMWPVCPSRPVSCSSRGTTSPTCLQINQP